MRKLTRHLIYVACLRAWAQRSCMLSLRATSLRVFMHSTPTHTPHGFRYLNETRLRSGVTEVISHLQTRSQANGISINVFSFGQVSSEWNADVKLQCGPHHEEAWLLQRQNENQLPRSLNTSRKKKRGKIREKRLLLLTWELQLNFPRRCVVKLEKKRETNVYKI